MSARPVLDVTHLPSDAFDHHAPLWWGNLLMIVIETTMFACLVASYFYIAMYTSPFPPPRASGPLPSLHDTTPDLPVGTVNMLLLLASCVPMYFADRAARRMEAIPVVVWLAVAVLAGVAAVALRAFEFPAMHFRWDSNAYGSVVWYFLGFHLLHLLSATVETLLLALWVWAKGLDQKHAKDATINAVYWYWMAGVWVPIYLILYFAPRLI